MLFPTLTFGLFFLAVYAVAWSAGASNEWRKILLLLASWTFYGAWDWRFVALLIGSALLNWAAAQAIGRSAGARRRKALLILGVASNLSILIFFKYFDFFVEQAGLLLAVAGWERDLPLIAVILPIGVSFFTFQGISYIVDVYRGKVAPGALLDITLLMSFFPHLVAGPIVRASDLLPQFAERPRITRGMATMGLLLIIWGLFKKAVIASELATGLVDPVFFDPSQHGRIDLAAAGYGYAVQIYCDFSAYSDMAIGIAALLGYRFPHNFNQPYRAASLQDFWRRWHISLSSWLRDYLYIPLGGSRGGALAAARNLMITMLLGGLWHGAKWTFLIWGGLHGLVLSLERAWRATKPDGWPSLPRPLAILLTFHVVTLGWIFFRAESFVAARDYLAGFARIDAGELAVTPLAALLILFGLAIHFTPRHLMQRIALIALRWPALLAGGVAGILILLIDTLRFEGVAPFIYYQF